MVTELKLKEPATYFPSIKKKYGQPIEHWIKLSSKPSEPALKVVHLWPMSSKVPKVMVPFYGLYLQK
jgi:hypothetical protein